MIMPNNIEIKSKKTKIDTNGDIILNVAGVCWYTNLDINKRHENLILIRKYNPEDFPTYDNYSAINVDKVTEIPYDYEGAIGVPITFMDKYNPDQFEILGATESEGKGFSNGLWIEESGIAQPLIKGIKKYKRLFVRNKYPMLKKEG